MSSPAVPRHRTTPTSRRAVVSAPRPAEDGPRHLTAAGRDAERLLALELEVAQLRTAMASRAVIEQAKGVLMLLTGCSDDRSFQLMTHISSHTHRKVRDVAGELVASAVGREELPADVREILRDACPPPRRTG